MSFSSLDFVFWFLPAFLAVYYITPRSFRNLPLLLGSLVFYGWGVQSQPWCLVLLAGLLLVTYVGGLLLAGGEEPRSGLLGFLWTILFGCLLAFKYLGLFSGSQIVLPLGMSFYTFQMAAYLMDVHRGDLYPERSLYRFAIGILLFPKLLSGPLVSWNSLSRQIQRRSYSAREFDSGLRDFVLGLGLKLLLADRIGALWTQIGNIGYESVSAPLAWLGLVAYSLQLYFDFYGYSKMAVGLGRMLGFQLPENFQHPYAAKSMTDFWRRWHITLSQWFRDYVYIPLGGNRKGRAAQIRNLLIVWLLTGMWHGATVNFLLWGLFLFLLLTLEKLFWGKFLERTPVIGHIYMVPAILLSWMLFAISDLERLAVYAGRLVSEWSWQAADFQRALGQYGWLLAVGILVSTPLPAKLWNKLKFSALGTIFLFAIFWVAVYCMAAGLNDPFMYFSF
jgi:alginate O-acetyltransferase complex protein AlgI